MLDGIARRILDPALNRLASGLAARGVTADGLTVSGLTIGLGAALAISFGWLVIGLTLLLVSRLADGLDGPVARATGGGTDRGGYIDIVFDFAFYGAIPLAFAVHDPAQNAIPAIVLLFSFYVNGASFLAYSAIAARRGFDDKPRGDKTVYFTTGLAEGTETIAVFCAFCLFPAWFGPIAYGFAALCGATAISRVWQAWTRF